MKILVATTSILAFITLGVINTGVAQPAGAEVVQHFWLWSFLGRLHPMIVHFPVGILIAALLMEVIEWRWKNNNFNSAIKVLVCIGAISAVFSVVFGLLLSNTEEYGSDILGIHQWTGIATMVLGLCSAYMYLKGSRRMQVALLTLTVIGVTIAGHYGAGLTHGEDYLTSVLPAEDVLPEKDNPVFALASQKEPLTESQVQDLNVQVRTILAHNCYSCHGSTKVKGELRLDTKDLIMKGGEHGAVVVPGHPEKSEMIRRISLPRSEKKSMPTKGKGLTKDEIAVLAFWIKQGAPWPAGKEKSLYRVADLAPRSPAVPAAKGDLTQPIDLFVDAYFKKKNIQWQQPVDDRTYIRRVFLDVTGLLPTANDIDAFMQDRRADKRSQLVQRLLQQNEAYAQHWLTFWNDALRNDYSGTGYITGGRFDITQWLYTSLIANKPYDVFVKELINPAKQSEGFIRGIQWRGTINASQRTEMQAAQNVAQVFMGLNLKCASCHDSFISDWKLDDAYSFANIFADSTLEINRCDVPTGRMAGTRVLYSELGNVDAKAKKQERLKQLADVLVQPKDGRLYRTLVNRIWAQVMGRGIVEPVDAMDNEPWSQDLLDWMASDFVANGCDIKKLLYQVLISRTYQLPSQSVKEPDQIIAPAYVFKGMMRRRLTAEEFSDAVSETIQPIFPDSAVVYKLFPNSVKQSMHFPRAAFVMNNAFLTALGRPNRETVSTSRASQASLLQALELTNGTLFNKAMERGAERLQQKYPDAKTMIQEVYKSTLGRSPTNDEQAVAYKMLGDKPGKDAIQDFVWTMTLHPEFQLIY
ncbi:DUF1549 domain-containing protein [Danxiaibacter flavus]|uniref:DUF1549 domain-containing protein n=1 Tax=Danxiaibacter flavus TaxID=3049108 RepID=A0ABV3ZAG0_9BACT|nr:DUF1549 domain-containing protein [Chitinophagaceae bacterium DXS]